MARRTAEDIQDAILAALKVPLTRKELMDKLKLASGTADTALKTLSSKGAIARADSSYRAPWVLLKKASSPAATAESAPAAPAIRATKNGHHVRDLQLKLQALDGHIAAAKADGATISAFIFGEIRNDLARLAGAA